VSNRDILKLALGFRKFRERYFAETTTLYDKLNTQGQSPKTLVIGCSDSRVDPALLCSASPGDIFVIRNVANLVPPYDESAKGYHGVSSAIEFAVVNLKVSNVVILGHSQCGGIQALVSPQESRADGFVNQWMSIAASAREKVFAEYPNATNEELCSHCEKEAIVASLANLKTFPFVQDTIKERSLAIFPLFFDLENGQLLEYSETEAAFKALAI
jgi:carbonic anhydrase